MYASFNHFEIQLTKDQAMTGCHQGNCEDDVNYLLTLPAIKQQLKKISNKDLISELSEYGVWTNEDLKNRKDNEQRIIWLAAGSIIDEM